MDPGAGNPSQRGALGERRERVQPRPIRIQVVQPGAIHAICRGAPELHRPVFRHDGSQDHTGHLDIEVQFHNLGELPPRSGYHTHHKAEVWGPSVLEATALMSDNLSIYKRSSLPWRRRIFWKNESKSV